MKPAPPVIKIRPFIPFLRCRSSSAPLLGSQTMKPAAHEVRPVECRAGEGRDGGPGRVPGPERLGEEGAAPGPVLLSQMQSVISRRRHDIPCRPLPAETAAGVFDPRY